MKTTLKIISLKLRYPFVILALYLMKPLGKSEENTAYLAGKNDAGVGYRKNPYPSGSHQHSDYDEAFYDYLNK